VSNHRNPTARGSRISVSIPQLLLAVALFITLIVIFGYMLATILTDAATFLVDES
jgi:hypothetical protein